MAHGELYAGEGEGLDGVAGHECPFVHDLLFFGAEPAEHEIDLCSAREVVPYAEAETVVALSAQRLRDVLETIVAAVASVLPDADDG